MLRPGHDLLLHLVVQVDEVGGVARDAHQQVPVLGGLFPGGLHGLPGNHVELHVLAAVGKVGADEGGQLRTVSLRAQGIR